MDTLVVLHLEDNPDDAFFLKRFIDRHLDKSRCVVQLLHVVTRDAYVAALEQQRPDLVISDNNLPGCSSLDALELARAKYPDTPFLVLSGLVREEVAHLLVENGAAAVIAKNQLALVLPILQDLTAGKGSSGESAEALREALARSSALAQQRLKQLDVANKELALRTAQLEAATGELEAYSQAVAHDLRAPLHNINVYALLMIEEYHSSLDKQAKDFLGRISSEADRLTGMIDNLHWLASYSSVELKYSRVDLSTIARDYFAHVQQAAPQRQARVRVEDGVEVAGDPDLLKIMLENLLGNAWKHTRSRSVAEIAFGSTRGKDGGEYFIRDNGVGFDMRYAEKLFTPFQQLHSARELRGSGLGLATVKRIINRHGGSVRAEASTDQGATFYFTLPR